MRFGMRLGPFWVSSSTRRRAPRTYQAVYRDEHGRERRCEHSHRTLEAAQACARRETSKRQEAARAAEAQRVARLSAAEYRQHAIDSDPAFADWLRRKEAAERAQMDAELQKMKDELRGEAGS